MKNAIGKVLCAALCASLIGCDKDKNDTKVDVRRNTEIEVKAEKKEIFHGLEILEGSDKFFFGNRLVVVPLGLKQACLPSALNGDSSCPEAKIERNAYEYMLKITMQDAEEDRSPSMYEYLLKAKRLGWVKQEIHIRDDLDRVLIEQPGRPVRAYFIAKKMKGFDGLPPVAMCTVGEWHKSRMADNSFLTGSGSTSFIWRRNILVGATWSEALCKDFPEIYQFIVSRLDEGREIVR